MPKKKAKKQEQPKQQVQQPTRKKKPVTELGRIAQICREQGISYGQYRAQETGRGIWGIRV